MNKRVAIKFTFRTNRPRRSVFLRGLLFPLLFRQRGAGAQRLRSSIVFINNVICGYFNSSPRWGAPLYYKKEERFWAQ